MRSRVRPASRLGVEVLEARDVPSAAPPAADPGPVVSPTEVVVAVRSSAAADLLRAVPGASRLVDWDRTFEVLAAGREAVWQVGLVAGVDPAKAVLTLEAAEGVVWAAPNYVYPSPEVADPREYVPGDPSYGTQYHHARMASPGAWDVTYGRAGVVIAVTDDGVYLNHEDLFQNIWLNWGEIPASRRDYLVDVDGDGVLGYVDLNDPVNQGEYRITDVNGNGRIDPGDVLAPMVRVDGVDQGTGGWADGADGDGNGRVDDLAGWDFSSNDNNPNPVGSATHGTHVAGIAAARVDNGVGVAGVAGGATIMPIRFYGSGAWTSAVIAASYRYAADNGARIISTSYSVDQFANDPTFRAALDYIYDAGVLHLNSAGNNNQLNPARGRFDQTLYVASTDSADRRAGNSNYGYTIDVAAPGVNIYSTLAGTTAQPNGRYGLNSGTSMATPAAAGVAALIWSVYPWLTRDQVAAQLVGTADNIDALNPAYAGLLGSGRVNADRAVNGWLAAPRIDRVIGLPAEFGTTTAPVTTFSVDPAHVLDPATVSAAAFELRGAGADGAFDTEDDVLLALSLPDGFVYRVGTNRLTFTVAGMGGAYDTYRFRALAGGLADPFGQLLDGDGDGVGGDPFDRYFYYSPF